MLITDFVVRRDFGNYGILIIFDSEKGSHVHGMFNALLAPLFVGASVIALAHLGLLVLIEFHFMQKVSFETLTRGILNYYVVLETSRALVVLISKLSMCEGGIYAKV